MSTNGGVKGQSSWSQNSTSKPLKKKRNPYPQSTIFSVDLKASSLDIQCPQHSIPPLQHHLARSRNPKRGHAERRARRHDGYVPGPADFFSRIWPHTLPHRPSMSELTPYVPLQKMIMPAYRPAVFSTDVATMKPATATSVLMVMCQVRSLRRPELHETSMVAMQARRWDGQTRMWPTILSSAGVLTTEGRIPHHGILDGLL